ALSESDVSPIRHPNYIEEICFAGDSDILAIASSGSSSTIWDIARAKARFGLGVDLQVARFSSDDRLLAVATWERTVRIFEMSSGDALTSPMRPTRRVKDLAFSSDNHLLLAISEDYDDDGEVTVWDISSATPIIGPLRFPDTRIEWSQLSPDARSILIVT